VGAIAKDVETTTEFFVPTLDLEIRGLLPKPRNFEQKGVPLFEEIISLPEKASDPRNLARDGFEHHPRPNGVQEHDSRASLP
jgi:hypothetical protein